MKRFFDLMLAGTALLVLLPCILFVSLLVKATSPGPILYWSQRVGINNKLFNMPKFRSMKTDAPIIATHEMNKRSDAAQQLTPIGSFLRKTSLDEVPQLWSVLKGDMSIVGPRPALFNQDDLIKLRAHAGVDQLKPGITGWAQVNGRDEIPIPKKVDLDVYYMQHHSFCMDCRIILLTFLKVLNRENVTH